MVFTTRRADWKFPSNGENANGIGCSFNSPQSVWTYFSNFSWRHVIVVVVAWAECCALSNL